MAVGRVMVVYNHHGKGTRTNPPKLCGLGSTISKEENLTDKFTANVCSYSHFFGKKWDFNLILVAAITKGLSNIREVMGLLRVMWFLLPFLT